MPAFYTDRVSRLKRPLYRVNNRGRYLLLRGKVKWDNAIRHLDGPSRIDFAKNELVVLCLMRNAVPWIRSFVRHYQQLGAKHIVFLDNGSSDGSLDLAMEHDHISLWETQLPFARYEGAMRRWLLERYGKNRWSLFCDVDELFEYPFSSELNLNGFLEYLNHHGYKVVAAQMLDMFSDQPFSELNSRPEDWLREKYRFYELDGITTRRDTYWINSNQVQDEEIACTIGGIRERVFGSRNLMQTKHSLVFADRRVNVYPYDHHFVTGAPVADVSAVLLHYKFVSSLKEQAAEALRLRQHSGGSKHYRGFHEVLSEVPDLRLHSQCAQELGSTDELVEQGLLVASERYREWVRAHTSRGEG